MANNWLQGFAAKMGLDVDMFDQFGQTLLGGGAPATSNTNQPQAAPAAPGQVPLPQMGDPGTGQPMFPVNPGGAMMAPPPTGTPTQWEPPPPVPMGYEGASSDRPTSIQAQLYQGMIDRGIPPHIADGFMMNAADESGFNLTIPGDNGNAKGLFQWNGPRKRAFEERYGDDWSMENQLDFLKYELEGPEAGAYAEIQKAQTPGEAAAAIVDHFERPAEENRLARREKYLGSDGGAWQSTSGGATGGEGDGIDYSALEDEVDEMTPEEQRRQARWAGLGAFSKGLGQMSHGQTIEVGDVFQDLVDRQKEARDRKSEIAKLKIQEQMDVRSNRWATEREQRGYEHADTAQEREQGFDLKKIADEHQYTEDQAQKFKDGVDKVATESADPLMKRAAEMVKSSNYTLTFADAVKELAPDMSGKLKEFTEYQHLLATDPVAAQQYYDYLTAPTTSLTDTVANTKAKALITDTSNRVTKGREALDKALAVRPALNSIDTVLSIARDQGVELTGPVSAQTQTIRTAMSELGIPLDTDINLAMQSAIQSSGAQLRPIIRAPGEQSNAELADTVTSLPGLADSPLGNQFKVQAMQGDLAYREARQNALETYRSERPDGSDTGFDKYWKDMETAGLTPINYVDFGVKTDRSLENAARAYQQGLLKEGSIIVDIDPAGNKYFRPVTAAEIQSLAKMTPQLDLIDHIPYPWEQPQESEG